MSRIGFDVDGVLADFSTAYQKVLIETSGRNLFHAGDAEDAPCWDWDKLRGYQPKEREAAWLAIRQDPSWWLNLPALEENCSSLRTMLSVLERKHDVYFITSRVGERAKRQAEIWLFDHLVYPMRAPGVYPTVMIAGHRTKGLFAKALGLNAYIDDNYDNVMDVAEMSPETRVYLRNRRYNREQMVGSYETGFSLQPYAPLRSTVRRVASLGEMFDAEIESDYL